MLQRQVLPPKHVEPPWLVALWIAAGGAAACLWVVISVLYLAVGP